MSTDPKRLSLTHLKDVLGSQERQLLALLLNLAKGEGCYADQLFLANKLEKSRRWVERYVAKLKAKGFLKMKRTRGTRSWYVPTATPMQFGGSRSANLADQDPHPLADQDPHPLADQDPHPLADQDPHPLADPKSSLPYRVYSSLVKEDFSSSLSPAAAAVASPLEEAERHFEALGIRTHPKIHRAIRREPERAAVYGRWLRVRVADQSDPVRNVVRFALGLFDDPEKYGFSAVQNGAGRAPVAVLIPPPLEGRAAQDATSTKRLEDKRRHVHGQRAKADAERQQRQREQEERIAWYDSLPDEQRQKVEDEVDAKFLLFKDEQAWIRRMRYVSHAEHWFKRKRHQ